MSDHPLIKHALKGYKAWKAPNVKLGKRIVEVFVEMAIIIFAITLSMALERWRDYSNKKDIEKQFFIEYKKDLLGDILKLKSDSSSFAGDVICFKYFMGNEKYSPDSIKMYYGLFFHTTVFNPSISHFEALKSTGNLDVIRNKQLLRDIISFYSESAPHLVNNNNFFAKFKTDYIIPYLYGHIKYDRSNINLVLHSDIAKNYLSTLNFAVINMNNCQDVVIDARHIIDEINAEQNRN